MNEQLESIGVAKLRKITSLHTSMELLKLAHDFAVEGYDKKLWSLLSRVYEDKKAFTDVEDVNDSTYFEKEEARDYIDGILKSAMPVEYKLQAFTSFNVPCEYAPAVEEAVKLIEGVSKKRSNIAGYFIARYGYEKDVYKYILANKEVFKIIVNKISSDRLILMYEQIILSENKEFITGAIRTLSELKPVVKYNDLQVVKRVTQYVFDSKEVFFTTKILYCITFNVPKSYLPDKKEIFKILKICVNYEERITREFIKKYKIEFAYDDEAMCKYYIGNKKAGNERLLVAKFANHLVRIEDKEVKSKLLRSAFKRGGHFRMYAGCMQDGCINMEKMRRFHYSDEQIEWCKGLSGLKEQNI